MYGAYMGEDEAHRIPGDAVEVSATELRSSLRDLLERVAFKGDELVVTRAGKAVAAIISMDAYIALRRLMAYYEDLADGGGVRAAQKAGDYVALEEALKGARGGPEG